MKTQVVGSVLSTEAVPGMVSKSRQRINKPSEQPENKDDGTERQGPDGLEHLPSTCRAHMEHLLRGRLHPEAEQQATHLPSRVVKLYVLSAGSDSVHERTALAKTVYPKLKRLCTQAYGIEFQAVDLRWGVQGSGLHSDPHNTKLLQQFITECQTMSIGPYCALLLGDKYGMVEAPAQIAVEEYEAIRRGITQMEELEMMERWYQKDTNIIPSVYILQHPDKGEQPVWESIHTLILSLLVKGARHAVHQAALSPHVLNDLNTAALEHEVRAALEGNASHDNIIPVFRTITDHAQFLDRAPVHEFVDLRPNSIEPDAEKADKLKKLIDAVVISTVPAKKEVYSVSYHDPDGMNERAHARYLEDMCTNFYNKATALIEKHVKEKLPVSVFPEDNLCIEVKQHWSVVEERVAEFSGRETEIDEISGYLMDETNQPFVVCGNHGDGKTSLVAMAARAIQEKQMEIEAQVVIRFCGLTKESTNIRELLYSLVHQIAIVTEHHRRQIPRTHNGIIKHLRSLLMSGNFPGILVLILDGLDQLSPEDNANQLEWLPSKLANNVKIIVTTVPNTNKIYHKLCSKIENEKYHLIIGPLAASQCSAMISAWLDSNGRVCNFYQWRHLKACFAACSSPLYTKIAFDEAMLWSSYMDTKDLILPTTVEECLTAIFRRLEEKHGSVLFSHCIAYITASNNGISHSEIEDLLSMDDDVLNSIFKTWQPALRRLPPIYWARLFTDLTVFLQQVQVDNTPVLKWAQHQILTVATKRYFSDPETIRKTHSSLANYFLGTYGGTRRKGFVYEDAIMKVMHIREKHSSAVRHLPEQPLTFTDLSSEERFNFRKLNQLPFHLIKAGRKEQANAEIFFNFQFLYTKLRASSTHTVLADFTLTKDCDHDVKLVAEALESSEDALAEDPKMLGIELTGRLLPHAAQFPNIKHLIHECDQAAMATCPVVAQWQTLPCPGAPMSYQCQNINNGELKLIQTDSTILLSSKNNDSAKLHLWDIQHNEVVPAFDVLPGSAIYPTPNGDYVHLFQKNQSLVTFRRDSGEMVGKVDFPVGVISSVAVGNRYTTFTFEQTSGPVVIDTEASMLINRFQYRSDIVALSQDERYIICNAGSSNLYIHELPLMERRCSVDILSLPTQIIYTSNPKHFLVAFQNKQVSLMEADFVTRRASSSAVLHEIELQDVVLSHTEKQLLIRASRSLYIFSLQRREIQQHIKAMPPGVFVERLSTFLGASFSADDSMIVAIRHTYLAVWDSTTFEPLRVFQTSVFPVSQLITAKEHNKVITLEGANIHVWNLDNLDTNAHYINQVITGPIAHVAHSINSPKIICCGETHAEARIYNGLTSECEHTLVHSHVYGGSLTGVKISPTGRFAVTGMLETDADYHEHTKPWAMLNEDKLWVVESGRMFRCLSNNRQVTFSPTDDKVVFFPCRYYDAGDWTYNQFIMNVINFGSGEDYEIELPQGDFVGEPVISSSGDYLAMLMQISPPPETNEAHALVPKIRLLVYSFEKYWNGIKYLKPHTLWTGFNEMENFLDVCSLDDDRILVTYGQGFKTLTHSSSGVLDRSLSIPKGTLVYGIRKDCVLNRITSWLSPQSLLSEMQISRNRTVFLDQQLQVFSGTSGAQQTSLSSINCKEGSAQLIQDGEFVVSISRNSKEVHVYRTSDGVRKARFFVHGTASHLEVGKQDNMIMLTCTDGRILLYSCILGQVDYMKTIVNRLPSRNLTSTISSLKHNVPTHPQRNGTVPSRAQSAAAVLPRDVQSIRKTLNEHRQLSAVTRGQHAAQMQRQPGYRIIQDAADRMTSQACCIQ